MFKEIKEEMNDPVIPLLSIYQKQLKTGLQGDTCISTFRTALFRIAPGSNPSVHWWVNGLKKLYIHVIIHYTYNSALKKMKILTHVITWMNPEVIMLSEID